VQILLPADFREEQRKIVLAYLVRGHEFNRHEWRQAVIAFDLLKHSMAVVGPKTIPFPIIYRQHVEDPYANAFIQKLYETESIEPASVKLWAEIAGQIVTNLTQIGLYRPNIPATRLLLAYCLYWWRSFTLGYALEIEVQQDLRQAGIQFEMHNLLKREERLSPYDIAVLGFKGDIKSSLYFLQAARSQTLPHDFYITRLSGKQGSRIMVVFVQQSMWQEIDGDTLLTLLEEIADTLPKAAHITHKGTTLTVIDYQLWKEKVRRRQSKEDKHD
jgi:hypothetical protein